MNSLVALQDEYEIWEADLYKERSVWKKESFALRKQEQKRKLESSTSRISNIFTPGMSTSKSSYGGEGGGAGSTDRGKQGRADGSAVSESDNGSRREIEDEIASVVSSGASAVMGALGWDPSGTRERKNANGAPAADNSMKRDESTDSIAQMGGSVGDAGGAGTALYVSDVVIPGATGPKHHPDRDSFGIRGGRRDREGATVNSQRMDSARAREQLMQQSDDADSD